MTSRVLGAVSALGLLLAAGSAQAAITFDDNVTPVNGVNNGMIFGSGNDNGSFTVDRNAGVELGLRGKLRHSAPSGAPANQFNSNGDGTYSFNAGVAPGQSFPTGEWSFEWAINTDYDNTTTLNVGDLTYVLGLDTDPNDATSFFTFDPINDANPATDGHWDHSFGTNATGGGAGVEAGDIGTYNTLKSDNNVAQQSWKAVWYIPGYDPTLDATYNIFLAAFDGNGAQVARTDIVIIQGEGGEVPEPATFGLLGAGLIGLGLARRRRKA